MLHNYLANKKIREIIKWYLGCKVTKKILQGLSLINKNSITEYAPEENQFNLSQIASYKEVTSKYQSLANLDQSFENFDDPLKVSSSNVVEKNFENYLTDELFLKLANKSKESNMNLLFIQFNIFARKIQRAFRRWIVERNIDLILKKDQIENIQHDDDDDDSIENFFEESLGDFQRIATNNKYKTTRELLEEIESNRSELYQSIVESERKYSNRKRILRDSVHSSSEKDPINPDQYLTRYDYVDEVYEDNTRYEGQKRNNMRNGTGTYVFQNGYVYKGNWKDDEMHGFGTMYVNGKVLYEGEWRNNHFHGRGLLYNLERQEALNQSCASNLDHIHLTWDRYEGEFYHGMRHGSGTLFYSNGDFFFGDFKNGTIHGKGSYTKPGVYKVAAVWENNILVEELMRGEDNSVNSSRLDKSKHI